MTPLHIATIGGHQVRFYLSPHDGPDFPWVVFADVLALGGFQPEAIDHWSGRRRENYPALSHDLPDGTLIVADPAAAGLLQWGMDAGWSKAPGLLREYQEASSRLFVTMHVGLSAEELEGLAQRAALRNMPVVPGATAVH